MRCVLVVALLLTMWSPASPGIVERRPMSLSGRSSRLPVITFSAPLAACMTLPDLACPVPEGGVWWSKYRSRLTLARRLTQPYRWRDRRATGLWNSWRISSSPCAERKEDQAMILTRERVTVTPSHLQRMAVVYLRQSSIRQVRENQESQRLQYALADRARGLGWVQVEVIDCDLGFSASAWSARREGFDRLTAMVARGQVGIIFSRELSRLSRSDSEWCRLMEVCQVFNTLLADDEQVYDLTTQNDQLILGIKGTLSVVELKVLKMRMQQGQEEKAKRGELVRVLPPGYRRDGDGHVVKDPDVRVQESIAIVFAKFRESWSVRRVYLWFRDEEMLLPVNVFGGGRSVIRWQRPNHAFVRSMLNNPFYAGAYVYGRTMTQAVVENGRLKKRPVFNHDPAGCRVFIRDHHEGYIDWASYEENQRMIRRNAPRSNREETMASVRSGQGALSGMLRCGACGRRLRTRYDSGATRSPRYFCSGEANGSDRHRFRIPGRPLDQRIGEEVLRVISPLGVEASLRALEKLSSVHAERLRAVSRQLQHEEYEAQRAFDQYNEVDARNRLVAAELERRWNMKLEEVERLKKDHEQLEREQSPVSDVERERIMALGRDFSQVWKDPHSAVDLRKKIIRTLIEEIIVNRAVPARNVTLVIHWKGGVHTEVVMKDPSRVTSQKTAEENIDIVRRMAQRYGDDQIAAVLNKLERRTGKGKRWTGPAVATVRHNHAIGGGGLKRPTPDILTLAAAAKFCDVSTDTIRMLVAHGLVENTQSIPYAPWEIHRQQLDSQPVREALGRLRRSGRLSLKGGISCEQKDLFK